MTIRRISLSIASLLALLAATPHAEAAYIINIEQVGSDVVATGSGSLNLTGLISLGPPGAANGSAMVDGNQSSVWVGVDSSLDVYSGLSGGGSFGSLDSAYATSATGLVVGILGGVGVVEVETGYVSGDTISGTGTWSNATIESLGLIAGTYVWTWGSGENADSFTVNIGAVPEPATLALLGLPLAATLISRRRRAG